MDSKVKLLTTLHLLDCLLQILTCICPSAILMLNATTSLQGVMHSPLCDKSAEYNVGTISGKELWRKGKMLMHSSPQPKQLNWTFGLN